MLSDIVTVFAGCENRELATRVPDDRNFDIWLPTQKAKKLSISVLRMLGRFSVASGASNVSAVESPIVGTQSAHFRFVILPRCRLQIGVVLPKCH